MFVKAISFARAVALLDSEPSDSPARRIIATLFEIPLEQLQSAIDQWRQDSARFRVVEGRVSMRVDLLPAWVVLGTVDPEHKTAKLGCLRYNTRRLTAEDPPTAEETSAAVSWLEAQGYQVSVGNVLVGNQ